MIAKPLPHYNEAILERFLDESLGEHEAGDVQTHLSECSRCRERLAAVAGDYPWWSETAAAFSELKDPASNESAPATDASLPNESVAWLAPILKVADGQPSNKNHDRERLGHISHYEIESVIGRGGMGVVLKGHDPTLGRPVALKVLSPHLAGMGAARARFKREAKAAAAIVHPSVVPIYAIEADVELPYLVMPLIEGENLQQRVDRDGPLPLEEVLRIGVAVAEGIVAAHQRGVIHRDIKPANLLLEKATDRVLISDFGLARALDDATITMSGMIAGTPSYMSPQQARGETATTDSDWFSFGSVLYTLATGRPPHRAECPLAVLRKITDTDARPIHEINEAMPAWVHDLVSLFMRRDTKVQALDGNEVVELLRLAHLHVTHPAVHPLPASITRTRRRSRWFRLAIALLGAMVCGIGFAAWSQRTQDESVPRPMTTPGTNARDVASAVLDPVLVADEETRWKDLELESLIRQLDRELSQHELSH